MIICQVEEGRVFWKRLQQPHFRERTRFVWNFRSAETVSSHLSSHHDRWVQDEHELFRLPQRGAHPLPILLPTSNFLFCNVFCRSCCSPLITKFLRISTRQKRRSWSVSIASSGGKNPIPFLPLFIFILGSKSVKHDRHFAGPFFLPERKVIFPQSSKNRKF